MADHPNILLITDDQHRWDFYGDTGVVPTLRTPNLDRLRAQGVTFDNNYAVCPVCMPNRFSWCYGLYPSQAAYRLLANGHDWPPPDRFPSMPAALQRAGYHTALVGKLHSHAGLYSKDISVLEWQTRERGYDDAWEVSGKSLSYWFDCRFTHHLKSRGLLSTYRADMERRNPQLGGRERYEPSPLPAEDAMDSVIGRQAVHWLQSYGGEKPFFLHASLCGPHFPLDPPEELFESYRPQDMPPPVGVDLAGDQERWQRLRASYCGLIELVDRQVGLILDALQQRGWTENTVILYGSDHGDMIGDGGLNGKGWWMDSSCRTPLTVSIPDGSPSHRETMAQSVDLPLTIMDLAGADPEALPQTPGRSVLPQVRGSDTPVRDWSYAECKNGDQEWRMAVDLDWKYVWQASGEELLFDRAADPWDRNNLIDRVSPKTASRMRQRLIQSLTGCVAPNTIPFYQTGRR
jgi:arylsulfatase A-like enzyme